MKEQIHKVLFWAVLTTVCFKLTVSNPVPPECKNDHEHYNEEDCKKLCETNTHKQEEYCVKFLAQPKMPVNNNLNSTVTASPTPSMKAGMENTSTEKTHAEKISTEKTSTEAEYKSSTENSKPEVETTTNKRVTEQAQEQKDVVDNKKDVNHNDDHGNSLSSRISLPSGLVITIICSLLTCYF